MDETARIDLTVNLWVEVSDNGETWKRPEPRMLATETGRDIREVFAILRSYVALSDAMGLSQTPVVPWHRVMMQGLTTGSLLAIVPRAFSFREQRYVATGGQWLITDTPRVAERWMMDYLIAETSNRLRSAC
ncbi:MULTISPECIES: hypothetical protein [unclassified Streptomyces]|uniref:hypothetical protein n=1 Tax=Streptomyces sp. NPDC056835 TaxID=3345956 RepID=UPI0036B9A6C3